MLKYSENTSVMPGLCASIKTESSILSNPFILLTIVSEDARYNSLSNFERLFLKISFRCFQVSCVRFESDIHIISGMTPLDLMNLAIVRASLSPRSERFRS